MSSDRIRLDQALVDRDLVSSRSRARALIMAGKVLVAGQLATKAGTPVAPDDEIGLVEAPRFASRGGEKLRAALDVSEISARRRVCLDIGASTGGFTDCLLQDGAAAVVAVDVGYGQLAWELRQNDRVFVIERVNARYMTADALPVDLPSTPDLLVADVSFIGLAKILPAAGELCAAGAEGLVLVKPQFECGPAQVGAGGIVVDAAARRGALIAVGTAAGALGWQVVQAIPSPIRGAGGNWECFLQLRRPRTSVEAASLEEVFRAIEVPEG